MLKKLIALIAAASVMSTAAFAQVFQIETGKNEAQVMTDAIEVIPTQNAPVCKNGRTLIEAEDAQKIFGIDIAVTGDEITVTREDKSVKLSVGKNTIEADSTAELDVAPEYIDGKLFIPLRAVLENLGWSVGYSAALNKVVVSNEPVIMEVSGNKIRLDEFNLYYDIQVKQLEAYGITADGVAEYENQLKEQVINSLKELNALYYAAADSGFETMLEMTGAKQEIATYVDDFSENSGIIVLDARVGTELEKSNIVNNYMQAVGMSVSVSDEEINSLYNAEYVTAKHILIPSVNLETGEALSETEAAKKLAEDIAKKIEDGEDFDKLMNEHSKDTGLESYPDGYTFTKGEMVAEFEAAAFALKENEISDIIETSYGYHIIKRLPLAELSEEAKGNLKTFIGNKKVAEYVDSVINQSDIKIYSE